MSVKETDAGRRASLNPDAPWRWLGAGWRDLMHAPALSVGYGLAVIGGGLLVIWLLWKNGLSSLTPIAFGVFALVGPLLAVGLYEMSRRIEAGESPRLYPIAFAGPRAPLQISFIGFFIMFSALVWMRIAIMLYALFTNGDYVPLHEFTAFALTTGRGVAMITIGTLIGGAIAFTIYLFTVVSIPMLMHQRTDAFTAVATGIRAFQKHPGTMLLWAWLIAIIIAAGIASFFVGLALAFPLLGHASWHAYREISQSV